MNRPEPQESIRQTWPWWIVLCGYAASVAIVAVPIEHLLLQVALLLFAFYAIQFTAVFLHELGHLLVCAAVGMLPATLQIGSGPVVGEFAFGRVSLQFRSTTNCGMVIPRMGLRHQRRSILLFLYAAGPMVDLAGLALVIKLWAYPPLFLRSLPTYENQIKPFLFLAGVYLFYCHLSYLLRPGVFASDRTHDAGGLASAWRFLQSPKTVRAAYARLGERMFQSASTGFPKNATLADGADLQTYCEWAIGRPGATPEEINEIKDLLVTATVIYGWKSQLPLADRFSAELIASTPDRLTFQGSRGSVEIALGLLAEGKARLEMVFSESQSAVVRCICAAYIAIAELRLGNIGRSKEWLEVAEEADRESPVIDVARAELGPICNSIKP